MQLPKLAISAAVIGAVAFLCFPLSVNAKSPDKPSKFFVRFAAISTAVHSAWFGSQDVYLVELNKGRRGAPFLAKLVDEYPDYEGALPRELLASDGSHLIKVKREPRCDVHYSDMAKSTIIGDRLAAPPSPPKFVPNLELQVADGAVVPCFRLLRHG